ncbi:LysR family transcriptional regulator [Aquabacterium sp. A08]|uniref:LysR family transcriptional regulator n=1 Tax=Aquabacterium sp. A08 TaxID=2718532 RepID=UPI001FBB0163|nr:LysR family transcriptional regulator [Aquabacterium sp. A08]
MELSTAGIDPNDLLIFAQVAERGSFSRAAEALGLPKSTVSRRLAGLELRLGERLLRRTTRRQWLTEFGLQLLEHARQVAAEVDAVAALSAHRQATPSGRLRVSMPSDLATLLLAEALAGFAADHPAVTLELDLSPRRVDLLAENFDLAVRMGELPSDASLAARRLAVFTNGLYASPAYLARHGHPQQPDDLPRHRAVRLLGRQGDALPWHLVQGQQHWHGRPAGGLVANSPELLIRLAAAGGGIAVVPDRFAALQVQRGQLVRVLPDWHPPAHDAWAVFPERRLMPTKTRAFIDRLQQALGAADLPQS